jgi:hypothetical protein
MSYRKFVLYFIFFISAKLLFGQAGDRKIINSYTTSLLPQGKLEFRVAHRFGDLNDGWTTFYGIESATDVNIGIEYGITDKLSFGIDRTRGFGPLIKNINLTAKLKVFSAGEQFPLDWMVFMSNSISTMEKSEDSEALNFFRKYMHRMSTTFGSVFSTDPNKPFVGQFTAGFTHRNLVKNGDINDLPFIGLAAKTKISRIMNLTGEFTLPFQKDRINKEIYQPIYGLGIEFDTKGGHYYQLFITNSRSIQINDMIPYNTATIDNGEIRIGFELSRIF